MTVSGVDSVFGANLRILFVAAGDPTLKSCARAISGRRGAVSAQRVSDWRTGRHRPKDFATVEPLLQWLTERAVELGADDSLLTAEQWKALWAAEDLAGGDDATTRSAAVELVRRPFRGLQTLGAEDSDIFFGRTEMVDTLVSVISATAAGDRGRIVVVTGPSGAGKSSLLGAGLATSADVTVVTHHRPDSVPPADLIDPAAVAAVTPGAIPVAVLDQFEELFAGDAADAADYVRALDESITAHAVVAVIGVRADFFDRCVEIPALAQAWQHACVIVPAMSERQLREIITGPARLAGCRVDTGLADLIIGDVNRSACGQDTAGRLPLLAHVLQATWARRTNGRMTVSGYRATGGVSTAVADTAERAWEQVAESDHALARNLLLALTYAGPDGRAVRSSLSPADVGRRFGRRMDPVIDVFVAERLLVADNDRIEFAHEIVLEAWPRLRRWINEDRGAAVIRHEIDTAVRAWIGADRHNDFLYTAGQLEMAAVADTSTADGSSLLSDEATQFLRTSSRHERRRRRARRSAVASVVVLAVAALVAASIAMVQTHTAAAERNDAEFRSMTSQLPNLRTENPSLAAELAMIAQQERPDDPAVMGDFLAAAGAPLQSTLPGHRGAVYGVAYNRDSTLLASAGEDRTVQLWRMTTESPTPAATLNGFDNYVTSVAFDPVAPVLATGSGDGTARLWDVADPDHPRQIGPSLSPGHGTVYNVAFSPDGRTLAAPSDDGTVTLFDVADPTRPVQRSQLSGHTGAVRTVAFSPNGRLAATGSDDQTTRLWDVTDPAHPVAFPRPIRGLSSINHSVSFDATGTRLAITGDTVNAQIWDVADPADSRPLTLDVHGTTAKSWSIAFGPRPGWLASAGLDGVIHTWNADDPAQVTETATLSAVSTQEPGAFGLQYSPDGTQLAGGYADGNVRIWHFPTGDLTDRSGAVGTIAADAGRRMLATTGTDGTLHLLGLDPSMTKPPTPLSSIGIDHRVNDRASVAVAADGTQVATENNNGGRVQIWDSSDLRSPREVANLATETRYTDALAYSSSGHILATGQTDTTVQVWDLTDPQAPVRTRSVLVGPTDLVSGLSFDRAGRLLAVSSDDGTVRIYDVTRPDPGPVATIATGTKTPPMFEADSDVLVVGVPDGLQLWDVHDPAVPVLLSAVDESAPAPVSISPDGTRLALATSDARLVVEDISDPRHPRSVTGSVVQPMSSSAAAEDTRWQAVIGAHNTGLVAAISTEPTLRERTLDVESATSAICHRIGVPPSRDEWDRTITGVDYRTPCAS